MPNVEALEQLKRVVLAAPASRFEMRSYQCGTSFCAAGWAALDPWHQQNTEINHYLPVVSKGKSEGIADDLKEGIPEGLGGIYGISESDVMRLFYPCRKLTKKQVISSIDCIVAGDGAIDFDGDE